MVHWINKAVLTKAHGDWSRKQRACMSLHQVLCVCVMDFADIFVGLITVGVDVSLTLAWSWNFFFCQLGIFFNFHRALKGILPHLSVSYLSCLVVVSWRSVFYEEKWRLCFSDGQRRKKRAGKSRGKGNCG